MELNSIFYINKYSEAYNFICNNQPHMTIIELNPDEHGRRFQIVLAEEETEAFKIQNQINELKDWFDNYYTQHEQKYRRLHLLNQPTDEGSDALSALMALYTEAEEKRKLIQSLEAQIGLA